VRGGDIVTCFYCDRPGEYLCDFILEARSFVPGPLDSAEAVYQGMMNPVAVHVRSCDRPLCDAHRVCKGHAFYCGEAGRVESLDFCPGHARGPESRPPRNRVGGGRAA
jgi:hypothetical protein